MSFIRDNVCNIGKYLPAFVQSDQELAGLLQTESAEHNTQRLQLKDILDQFFVKTATWSLDEYEKILDIVPDAGDTYERRRNRILVKLSGRQTSTVDFMSRLISRYIDGAGGHIEEHNKKNTFSVVIEGLIEDKKGMDEAIETFKPAHLRYDYLFHIIDLSDDPIKKMLAAGDDTGLDIRKTMYDVVPYGISKHLLYGRDWQYADAYTYKDLVYGRLRAYGDIIKAGTVQYEQHTGWQFVPAGAAQYDGTWQYDGSYIYNGEKPYTIQYNDFMDELSIIILSMQKPGGDTELQDNIEADLTYGEDVPYGSRRIGANPLPIDCDGMLTIIRGHRYGSGRRYNYGAKFAYSGRVTYAHMQYEGGETYGPRRQYAKLYRRISC